MTGSEGTPPGFPRGISAGSRRENSLGTLMKYSARFSATFLPDLSGNRDITLNWMGFSNLLKFLTCLKKFRFASLAVG